MDYFKNCVHLFNNCGIILKNYGILLKNCLTDFNGPKIL